MDSKRCVCIFSVDDVIRYPSKNQKIFMLFDVQRLTVNLGIDVNNIIHTIGICLAFAGANSSTALNFQ